MMGGGGEQRLSVVSACVLYAVVSSLVALYYLSPLLLLWKSTIESESEEKWIQSLLFRLWGQSPRGSGARFARMRVIELLLFGS